MGIIDKLKGFFSRTKTDSRPEARIDKADGTDGVSKIDFYANPGTYDHISRPDVKSKRPFDFGYVEKKKDETTPWEDFRKSYKDIVKKEEGEK